jgi:hypothetical protein
MRRKVQHSLIASRAASGLSPRSIRLNGASGASLAMHEEAERG